MGSNCVGCTGHKAYLETILAIQCIRGARSSRGHASKPPPSIDLDTSFLLILLFFQCLFFTCTVFTNSICNNAGAGRPGAAAPAIKLIIIIIIILVTVRMRTSIYISRDIGTARPLTSLMGLAQGRPKYICVYLYFSQR